MTREQAIAIIDEHKNALVDPVRMLEWTYIRVIINHLSDEVWDKALAEAEELRS